MVIRMADTQGSSRTRQGRRRALPRRSRSSNSTSSR